MTQRLEFDGGSAVLGGPDDCYRYELRRVWNAGLPLLVVCMLNPSTADHRRNDPTVLTLIHFATAWGYGGLLIVNLFALRSPTPKVLPLRSDRVGPANAAYIEAALVYALSALTAWGNGGDLDDRAEWFVSRARNTHQLDLACLGVTKHGHPKHPMARGLHRIPRDQQPIVWRAAA